MKNYLIYSFFLVLSLTCSPLLAHLSTFRGISMPDGLSDLLVNVIYKDSTGFVWIGTDNCLDRFDGVNMKHYPFHSPDVKRKRVTAIAEMDAVYLWIGNGLGLWRLNRTTDTMERVAPETVDCGVSALYPDKNGKLYIGTEKGLFIYESGNFKKVTLDPNILSSSNHIMALEADEEGTMWLATTQELYSYNPVTGQLTLHTARNAAGQHLYYFTCVTRIDNTLYLGTNNQGIVRFDILRKSFSGFVDVGCRIISSISGDGKDLIYVSTDGNGVHFLSHSRKKIVRSLRHDTKDKGSIRSNSVYSLLVDKENIVWIGFYQAGFDYSLYQSGLFTVYNFPPYFDSVNMQVRSFLIHEDRKLIGTRDGLFYIDEAKKQFKSFLMPELRANLILSINHYEGEYYIGTYGGGLSVIDPETLSVRDFTATGSSVFKSGHIFCLKPDKEGNLWMGTSGGAYCYNKRTKELKEYTHVNSQIPEGNVYEIFFDSTGKGWICAENGMGLYDSGTKSIKTNVFPEEFVHKEKIRSIYENSRNNLYFLPDKGSMLVSNLTMSGFYRVPMNPALKGNAYMSIVEDDNNWIWLGCDDGLIRIREGEKTYDIYNFSDGIPNPTFTNNAAYKDEQGTLWFGNAKGLLFIDPDDANEVCRTPYQMVLTDLQVNGNTLDAEERQKALAGGEITLAHDQNNLAFSFVNFLYTDPSTMVYEYKLEGWDKEWKHITGLNKALYYGLSSGTYTFKVRTPGDEESEVNLAVVIHPLLPAWLWATLVLIALIVLYGAVRFGLVRTSKQKTVVSLFPETEPAGDYPDDPAAKASKEKYKTNRLTAEECEQLREKLSHYMDEDKPYTNPDLKIADLANGINTSSHSLSYFFNQYLNQSYYDYINEYRIAEFKKLVNNSRYSRYTLSALAELCGFSSRASFFRSFKKITGITPNEYIRSIGATNE